MPPIPGGSGERAGYPLPQGGGAGSGMPQGGNPLPLPMPGGGNNPYGDLSDIIRRGGGPDSGGLGSIVRNVLGGLLGFSGRGIMGWIVRLLLVRFGWGLLKRMLGKMLTGR